MNHVTEAARRIEQASVQMQIAEQARRMSQTRPGIAGVLLLHTALEATRLARRDIADANALIGELR